MALNPFKSKLKKKSKAAQKNSESSGCGTVPKSSGAAVSGSSHAPVMGAVTKEIDTSSQTHQVRGEPIQT